MFPSKKVFLSWRPVLLKDIWGFLRVEYTEKAGCPSSLDNISSFVGYSKVLLGVYQREKVQSLHWEVSSPTSAGRTIILVEGDIFGKVLKHQVVSDSRNLPQSIKKLRAFFILGIFGWNPKQRSQNLRFMLRSVLVWHPRCFKASSRMEDFASNAKERPVVAQPNGGKRMSRARPHNKTILWVQKGPRKTKVFG